MPSLTQNIEYRVRKLPKPSNAAQGLQPLFEAVSNAIFAIEDRFGAERLSEGKITITVNNLALTDKISVVVQDNGIGLDDARFHAFCELDTDFKSQKGGKGVGRLFWLDAFVTIQITSVYQADKILAKRSFGFALNNKEQIVLEPEIGVVRPNETTGTSVSFLRLRSKEYADHFPRRAVTFLRHFSAHFIADFLLGTGPLITVDLDGNLTQFPKAIVDLVVGKPLKAGPFVHKEFGELSITGFTCHSKVSTGLDGQHQLHLLANGRTVESRKVDNLLGLKSLERDDQIDLIFHGCVSGEYLDSRVNEGRTAFNIPERTLKDISRACIENVKENLLPEQIAKFISKRKESYEEFVSRHPIYGFDDNETQLSRVPFYATEPEDFAAGLVKFQIRREEDRQDALQSVIEALDLETIPANFAATVVKAAQEIHKSEQLALAQHVVRRKLVLELLEKLLRRMRQREHSPDDFHLEKTLHSFICPMGVRGDDSSEFKSRAHDLWIVDERFAFTRAFSSDKRLDQLLASGGTSARPDLIIWDLAFGLGIADPEKNPDTVDISEPLKNVMVVEFKKPGRRNYQKADDQIEQQIIKYLSQMKNGEIETFDRERIRIARPC